MGDVKIIKDTYNCVINRTTTDDYKGDTVNFFITQNISIKSRQSINSKIAPFAATGFTQNLGRMPLEVNMSIMLTDNIDIPEDTKEAKYDRLMQLKNDGESLKLNIPSLPLGTNNFYISSCNLSIKQPSRIMIDISFDEILESSLKTSVQEAMNSELINSINTAIGDRFGVGVGASASNVVVTDLTQSEYFAEYFENNPITPNPVMDKFFSGR